ncbi:MAG TPA: hypothetical protein VF789_20640 [Thermoanaerobaculia bacterium]
MALWSGWSDGTKWVMGIISALIIAALIGGFRILLVPENSQVSSRDQTQKSENPESVVPSKIEPIKMSSELSQDQEVLSEPSEETENGAASNKDMALQNVIEVDGFRFGLRFCRREGSDIHCEIQVTNTKADEQVELSNLSRIIDDNGIEHRASHLYYRGETGTMSFVMELATDVPTTFGLRFSGAGKTKKIALLEFCCWSSKVQWKGLTIEGT